MKAKKDRMKRPKLQEKLASGAGQTRKLNVTYPMLEYAEKLHTNNIKEEKSASAAKRKSLPV